MTLVRAANNQASRIGVGVDPDAYADMIQSDTATGDATTITREFPNLMTDRPPLVLVADDEENIRFLVESALGIAGIATISVADGRAAIDAVANDRPDLIVLDVMMPELDGFEVVRRLRDGGDRTPVIFLTARDATGDRVRGLSEGGDDYMVKPFAVAELVARVKLRLAHTAEANRDLVLRCGDLQLDTEAHRVTKTGAIVELSPTEYKLLHMLLSNTGRVLTREQLLDHVWGYSFDGDSSVVDTYISYLRKKLDRAEPKLIHTIRGVGFCLRVDE